MSAIFQGWMYPGVPPTARLYEAHATAAMPAAVAPVNLDGPEAPGGTGFCFRPRDCEDLANASRPWQARLLAVGVGVRLDPEPIGGSLAGPGNQPVHQVLGLAAGDYRFSRLVLSSDANANTYDVAGNPSAYLGLAPVVLTDVLVKQADTLSAAAGTVYVAGWRDLGPLLSGVKAYVYRGEASSAGGLTTRRTGPYASVRTRPQPIAPGRLPAVAPWVAHEGVAVIDTSPDVWGVRIDVAAPADVIPATCTAVARMLVAVWSKGEARG